VVILAPEETISAVSAPAPVPEPAPEPVEEPVVQPPIPETVETIAPPPPPVREEEPAVVEIAMEKPEGLVQIACVYPKGFEKQGQNFVTTLRAACAAAKLQIVIQPVFIQPWAPDRIDIPSWTKAAYQAGADRFFVIAAKKDQALFKGVHGEAAKAGMASRIIMIEHVGLRTLYADILVELRRPT
jgi:hypothetical protein